ncbi:MAG: hypothetical protein PVJ80_13040 [Gemmatimonadota bacterium]|jgi:hypothetical protein
MRVVSAALVLSLAACGGDSSTGPDGSDSSLSMDVDGVTWHPDIVTAQRSSGVASVAAVETATAIGFSFGVPDSGSGTYTVGEIDVVVTYNNATEGWTASQVHGGSGTVTVTTLTSDRFAGTFSGVLPAQSGQMPATVTITNGTFDISF